ncbi:MAG: glycosyltransferase [Actinomycetota bacterium]
MLPTVPFPPISLDDYREPAGDEAVERLREAARPLQGARLLQINSTAFGGGVSELLLTQMGLLRDLGIEAEWRLIEGSDPFFAVTKAVHNGLQGMDVPWTHDMETTYLDRLRANTPAFPDDHDYVVIHDPQPCALLALLEEEGRRRGAWIWRCHIDTSTPTEAIWDFFVPYIDRYDAAVFTAKEYARDGIEGPALAFIPPTIDPLSAKNGPVDDAKQADVARRFGVDRNRPIVTQVSRFDPWKDPLGVIDAFRIVQGSVPDAQLVMIGSMADDDPEGSEFLSETQRHAGDDPDIHLLTNLDGVGNAEVNAIQRTSTVIVQKSLREGFGLVVAEGMWKRKPVVGGNVGGIRLQIDDGTSGYIVDSVEACADRITHLIRDPDARARIGEAAHDRVRDHFLTLRELEDYLRLMNSLS